MKLYLISQNVSKGYDTYDSAVVAAKNVSQARCVNPVHWRRDNFLQTEEQWKQVADVWASKPSDVIVEYLGPAKRGTKAGVICASFNEG